VPAEVYVCDGVAPVAVAPSPNFQAYVSDREFGAVDPDPFRLTGEPAIPE